MALCVSGCAILQCLGPARLTLPSLPYPFLTMHTPPAEDGRRALLQRIVAEARALPVPEVAPEHAAATTRLQQLQASFLDRLPAWTAAEERRVAALRQQQEEAEAEAVAADGASNGAARPGSSPLTEAPAQAGSGAVAASEPAPSAVAPAQKAPSAAILAESCSAAAQEQVASLQQQQQAVQPMQQPVEPAKLPDGPSAAQPPAEALSPGAALQQRMPVAPPQAQIGGQKVEAQQAQHADARAAPEEQLLAAKEAAMRLAESLSPRGPQTEVPQEQPQAQASTLLPPGFGPPAGAPAANPEQLRSPGAPAPLQDMPTPLLPPGLGAVLTPWAPSSAPSPAALAAAEAAARALYGARAPLFLSPAGSGPRPPPRPQQQQPLSRSGSAGSGSAGSGAALGAPYGGRSDGH